MDFIDNYEFLPLISDLSLEGDGIKWPLYSYHLNNTPISADQTLPYANAKPTECIAQLLFNEQDSGIAGYASVIQMAVIFSSNPLIDQINEVYYYLAILAAKELAHYAKQEQQYILEEIISKPMQKAYANTLAIEPFMQGLKLLKKSCEFSENNIILGVGEELAKTLGIASYQAYNYFNAETPQEIKDAWDKFNKLGSTLPTKLIMSLLYSQYDGANPSQKMSTALKHLLTSGAILFTAYALGWQNKESIFNICKQYLIDDIAFSSFIKNIVPGDHAFPYFVAGAINAVFDGIIPDSRGKRIK